MRHAKRHTRLAVMVSILSIWAGAASAQRTEPRKSPRTIDAAVEKARQDWGVVGLAVAIVKGDSVVYAKGFGLRETGRTEPVDENTLFAIGSNTKAFTAAAIGILVQERKMGWDDPVTKYLPHFQLFDPYATREMRIRDLLSHRSGLSRGDAIWYATPFDRAEVIRRVRYLEPSWSFRAQYGYQNIMFLTAGEALAAAAGTSWDEFIVNRIFRPLGMTRSNTTIRDLTRDSNVATPHARVAGQPVAIAWRNIDNIAPAGSINSSAREMAQWLRLHVNDGVYNGQRILNQATIRELRTPHSISGAGMDTIFPMSHFTLYGLGVGLRDYHGRRMVQHTGGIDGMLSSVMMVPEERLGVVILTNTEGQNGYVPLGYWLIDAFLDVPERDWNAIFLATDRRNRQRADSAEAALLRSRVANTSPALPLDRYSGTYEHTMYGEARVALENGRLVLRRFDTFTGTLEHWHYDTFRVRWEHPRQEPIMITFRLDSAGNVSGAEIQGLGTYRRVSSAANTSTSR